MAIISPQTAPNFAHGEYFRILRAELNCAPNNPEPSWTIWVGFYFNEYARDQNTDPMYTHAVHIPLREIPTGDPRDGLYTLLLETELFKGKSTSYG